MTDTNPTSVTSDLQRVSGSSLPDRWYALDFDLRMSTRYHMVRKRYFDRVHTLISLANAIFGSATIAAVVASYEEVAVSASLFVALASSIDGVIGFSQRARTHDGLARRFIELECALLESEISEDSYRKNLAARRRLEADEPPAKEWLVRRCHREIALLDGHKDGDDGVPALPAWKRFLANVFP